MTSHPETTTTPKRRLARLLLLIPLLAITVVGPSACYYGDYYGYRGYGYGGRDPVAESYERGYRGRGYGHGHGWGRDPVAESYERGYRGYGYYGGWGRGRYYDDYDRDHYWH